MFRINYTLPITIGLTFLFDEKYKPDAFKNIENKKELICTTERILLALGTYQATKQFKKVSFFKARPFLAEGFCLGLQSTLSLPSALFSLAHKTCLYPIVLRSPKTIPQFYIRDKGYQPVWNMHEYFSPKMKCRPLLSLVGFASSLFLLSSFTRAQLQVEQEDLGLLEGKKGLFHKLANKVASLKS